MTTQANSTARPQIRTSSILKPSKAGTKSQDGLDQQKFYGAQQLLYTTSTRVLPKHGPRFYACRCCRPLGSIRTGLRRLTASALIGTSTTTQHLSSACTPIRTSVAASATPHVTDVSTCCPSLLSIAMLCCIVTKIDSIVFSRVMERTRYQSLAAGTRPSSVAAQAFSNASQPCYFAMST